MTAGTCYDAGHAGSGDGFDRTMSDILSGNLRAIPLADVLLLVANNRLTGALRCSRAGVTKTLEWENGEIVFARSSEPGDRLGAYLLSQGKVTDAMLEQAEPMIGDQERLGKVLVRLGALTPSTLWEAVRGQTTEIIYSLFHWNDGAFEFREGKPPPEKISLESSVMNLIMEGTRRLDEWSRVKQKIGSDRVVLAQVKSMEEAAGAVSLSDLERTLLGHVDGRRTVRDTIDAAKGDEFECWQALHSLLSAGLIRIQLLAFDPPAAGAAPAPPADDAELDRTLERYGRAVAEIVGRARQAVGDQVVAGLRRHLREANFERADLLKDTAIEPDGRIDRRLLLANVAEDPPARRARNLQAALDRMLRMLADDLKGKVAVDDVLADLKKGEGSRST